MDLSRRPGHAPPAEQMQMDVKDRLSRVAVRVEHSPVAAGRDTAVLGDRRSAPHDRADDAVVVCLELVQRVDMTLGYDQHVYRRLRVGVLEGQQLLVLEDDLAGNLAAHNFAEETVGHSQILSVTTVLGMP